MLFYLCVAIMFTFYAFDLLFLVVVAMVARRAEIRELSKKQKVPPAPTTAPAGVTDKQKQVAVVEGAAGSDSPSNSDTTPVEEPAALGYSTCSALSAKLSDSATSGLDDLDRVPGSSSASGYGGFKPIVIGKTEVYNGNFPKVLIQLPMYNEEAHCDLIIKHCCKLNWPRDRLLIQVLDDSTKEAVRKKVDDAAAVCVENGHPVQVLRRDNRSGFKAGAMVEGLNRVEGQGFEYAAIFDADFEPAHEFLEEAIYPLHTNSRMAYVQCRWSFASCTTFLTWAQRCNLGFHFDVEQRARSYLGWFFNFNGTAGVWRIAAIHDAGGWESDTVVEDMDLSLRCYIRGWTAVYLPHVDNLNELPSTLSSYKTQQFRWLSGPMQILVKCFLIIWRSTNISFWRRLNCYWFFARYVLFALITVTVIAVPPVALWLDVWVWEWPEIYFIVAINFALAVYLYVTPFSMPYLMFSVAIGYYKTWAMLSGLLGLEKSKTWKVTAKYGSQAGGGLLRHLHKPYLLESLLSIYYAAMATATGFYANWMMLAYCAIMAILFAVLSFGDCYM